MLSSFSNPAIKSLAKSFRANYSAKLGPMQKIIMLTGAPGVGKGTYARLLADDFGYVKISPGDEIRKILNSKVNTTGMHPSAIEKLKANVQAGKLVPDEIIMELLYHKIMDPRASKGVILDGFPRTVSQLNTFTKVFPIHLCVNINHNVEYLMASLLGRRTCMDCGVSYSAYSYYKDGYELDVQMPTHAGVCDHCGGKVKTRDDDKEEIVKARLEEYVNKTYPILEKLEMNGNMIQFEAKRGMRDYPMLQQIINSKVGRPYYYQRFQNLDVQNIASYYNSIY